SHRSYVDRPSSSSPADDIQLILDKRLVIDAYVRVPLVGLEILTIDARLVIGSVATYLRFVEASNRLELTQQGGKALTELMEGMTESRSKGKVGGAVEGVKDALTPDDEDDGDEENTSETETQKQASE